MKCDKCGYKWNNRLIEPVSCPRCKRRFDYPKSSPKDKRKNGKC